MLEVNEKFCSQQLKQQLSKATPVSVEWATSKDGYNIPIYNNCRLHSTYSVTKEATRVTDSIQTDNNIVISLGISCGYHLQNLATNNKIIAVIFDYSLFNAIASKIDFSFLQNVTFIDISQLYEQLYLALSDNPKANCHILPTEYMLATNRQLVEQLKNSTTQMIANIRTEINTINAFGQTWQHNIDKNIKRYFENKLNFDSLEITNKIILVCGAGYSLTQNLDFIKKHRDVFYIAATDTSALVLVRAKIYPDSVFSFDAQNVSFQHFFALNEISQNIRLFVDFTSPINFCSDTVKTTLLFSSHPYRKIFEATKWNIKNFNSGCGNIGWATVDFFQTYAQQIPIVTVGLDFAYYQHYSYSKNCYLDDYKIIKQDYFNSYNKLDAKLFYRSSLTESNNNWATNSLLKSYANAVDNKTLTLSESPFCNLTFINKNDVLSLQKNCKATIDFDFTPFSQAEFNNIKTEYLKKDNTPILPYLISKKHSK